MIRQIKVKVAAKVNLSLNITGRANGYHLLDSVFASVSVYDTITVRDRVDGKVTVSFTNPNIPYERNRVLDAVHALRRRFGDFGVDIVVENRIPVGGGLGGSSADAAGVIRALDRIYGFSDRGVDLSAVAAEVGSDVPFMISGGFARVTGRGERLRFFSADVRKKAVLLSPDTPVLTAECFGRFDERGDVGNVADNDRLVAALESGKDFSPYVGNALTAAACSLNPAVSETLTALTAAGGAALMSGSGSACIGLFDAIPGLYEDNEIHFVKQGFEWL